MKLGSIFRSKTGSQDVMDKLDNFASKERYFLSLDEMACQDKAFFSEDIGLRPAQANVLYMHLFCGSSKSSLDPPKISPYTPAFASGDPPARASPPS